MIKEYRHKVTGERHVLLQVNGYVASFCIDDTLYYDTCLLEDGSFEDENLATNLELVGEHNDIN